MKVHPMPWDAFPTDVTSPMPTQLSGPTLETQRARTDAPTQQPQPAKVAKTLTLKQQADAVELAGRIKTKLILEHMCAGGVTDEDKEIALLAMSVLGEKPLAKKERE